jgi:hypothetical protein
MDWQRRAVSPGEAVLPSAMKSPLARFAAALLLLGWANHAGAIEKGSEEKPEHGPLKNGQFVWDPKAQPEGTVDIIINLAGQKLYVYRNGVLIGRSTISSGSKGRETPQGIYMILEKNLTHHSNKYHEASMPFMERLTWGGLAIHAGNLPGHPESHGCVHVPMDFAKKLYTATSEGDPVLIANANGKPSTTTAPNALLTGPPPAPPEPGPTPEPSASPPMAAAPDASPEATTPPPAPPTPAAPATPEETPTPPPAAPPTPAPTASPSPAAGAPSEIVWNPGEVPKGPVSIIFSSADKRVYVYRKGVQIGRADLAGPDAGHPFGNYVYVALAQTLPNGSHQWSLLGSGAGSGAPHLEDAAKGMVVPPEFREHLRDIVAPGTTLIVTDQPANPSKPSDPD